jgi:hypothetical protein
LFRQKKNIITYKNYNIRLIIYLIRLIYMTKQGNGNFKNTKDNTVLELQFLANGARITNSCERKKYKGKLNQQNY